MLRVPERAFASVLLVGAVLGACGRPGTSPRTSEGRRAAPTASGRTARTAPEAPRGFLGVLLAGESVDVAAEAAGRLRAVAVRAGDVVERGALLASLDTQVAGQDLEAARAVLSQAEIEEEKSVIALEDAAGKLARRQSFPEAFPKEEIVSAENQHAAAKAAVKGAQARVREQRIRVEQLARIAARGEVRAPFAGTVSVRYFEPRRHGRHRHADRPPRRRPRADGTARHPGERPAGPRAGAAGDDRPPRLRPRAARRDRDDLPRGRRALRHGAGRGEGGCRECRAVPPQPGEVVRVVPRTAPAPAGG